LSALTSTANVLDGLASGALSTAAVLGLTPEHVDALVEQALRQAEHGAVDDAVELLSALARVVPKRAVLPLLIGHLELERGRPGAALVAYAEAARRNAGDVALAADVDLAQAEVELRLGRITQARRRLENVVETGRDAAKARATALLGGAA
jgi:predicted Zn-dependent protease